MTKNIKAGWQNIVGDFNMSGVLLKHGDVLVGEPKFSIVNKSAHIGELALAMSIVQGKIRNVVKDSQGHKHKYAAIEKYYEVGFPLLSENKLTLIQLPAFDGEFVVINSLLMHSSDQWIEGSLHMKLIENKMLNACQIIGISITYGCRYAFRPMIGIAAVGEDEFQDADNIPPVCPAPNDHRRSEQPRIQVVPTIYDTARLKIRELGVPGATVTSALSAYNVTRLTELKETDVESFVNNLTDYVKMTKAAQGA